MTYRDRLRKISASGRLRTGSRLRVCELMCIQMTLQPKREFTCAQLQEMWGITSPSSVWRSAMALESRGLLTLIRGGVRPGVQGMVPHRYRAGPELIALIGLLRDDS